MVTINSIFELISVEDRDYEFSLRDELGRGAFGTVYRGRYLVCLAN